MNISETWHLNISSSFEKQIKDILKKYYKKDNRGKEKFLQFLSDFFNVLRFDPFLKNSKIETPPKNMLNENEELRKYYFIMPRLKGASAQGRIIYKINKETKDVFMLFIYTHKDYEKRPSDLEIRKRNADY